MVRAVVSNSHQVTHSICNTIPVTGIGVHSGKTVSLELRPALPNSGIRFFHMKDNLLIPASLEYIHSTSLSTCLKKDSFVVRTVEHLLASIYGMGIDDVDIFIFGSERDVEIPILDGSSASWIDLLTSSKRCPSEVARRYLKVDDKIRIESGDKFIQIEPSDMLSVNYTIDYRAHSIGIQQYETIITPESFIIEIAQARTFCLESDVSKMQQMGYGRGGSLQNAVVYGASGPLNADMRFENEPVRHKILDLLGDLALLGNPLLGKITAYGAGHDLHNQLCRAIQNKSEIAS